MAKKSDYFGLDRIISIILAIIPITSAVCGVITRIKEGAILAGILRIVLGWNIIYIADIVLMILKGRILRILKI
ncbi:MAG: hypothetical protein IJF10_03680 [Clostridia bacterium]|nr:hypothetical protein [Clostridia bacterium]